MRPSFCLSPDPAPSRTSSPLPGRPGSLVQQAQVRQNQRSFRLAKNNRSKSVWTLFQRKLLNNQTVWPVIFGLTGPICARALKSFHLFELQPRGHHDWPVKPTIRELSDEKRVLAVLIAARLMMEYNIQPTCQASGSCDSYSPPISARRSKRAIH